MAQCGYCRQEVGTDIRSVHFIEGRCRLRYTKKRDRNGCKTL